MIKSIILVLFGILFFNPCFSQDSDVKIPKSTSKIFKLGKKAMDLNDYFLAKKYFDALATRGIENNFQKFEYAKLLYKLGDNESSLEIVNQLIKEKHNDPLIFYYASIIYNSMGERKKSRDYAMFFLKKRGMYSEHKPEYTHLSNLKLYLDSFNRKTDTASSSVYNIEGPINSPGAEFSPIILRDGILYGTQDMTSINYYKSKNQKKDALKPTRSINQAKGVKEIFTESNKFPLEITDMEVSSFCYSLDNRVIYLSGCKYNEDLKKYKCDIYQSKFKENEWSIPELIQELTTEESSNTHVTIGFDVLRKSPIMFFSSDREGGRGGFDIYMSFYNTRRLKFSQPRNIGWKINTPKDEITPFYHRPTNNLFFSSNGRGGLGGHDVYYSKLKNGIFEPISTFSEEVNSPQDDVFFVANKSITNGYLVSNRYSDNSLVNPHCCDDIFYWDLTPKKKFSDTAALFVRDDETKELIEDYTYELYKLKSTKRELISQGKKNKPIDLHLTEKNAQYELNVSSDGYKSYQKKFTLNNGVLSEKDFYMIKEGVIDKDHAKVNILDEETKELIPNFKYSLFENTEDGLEKVTDGTSKYTIDLPKLKDNTKYKLFVESKGYENYSGQFDVQDGKLSQVDFMLSRNKSLDIDSAILTVRDVESKEIISKYNAKVYHIHDNKRTLVWEGNDNVPVDSTIFKDNHRYEVEILADGYDKRTDIITIKNGKLDKNTIFIKRDLNSQLNRSTCEIKIKAVNKKTGEEIPSFSYQIFKIDSNDLSFVENGIGSKETTIKDLLTNSTYEVEVYASKFYRKKQLIEVVNDSLYVIEFEMESLNFDPIILPLVEFEFDSITLTPTARHIIDSLLVPVLENNPTLRIELSAHTDSRGTDEYNESLSQRRAEAIRFYLIDNKKIYPERLESKGYGEYVPIAPNENPDGTDNPEGRQRNRRCEFRILTDEYDPY